MITRDVNAFLQLAKAITPDYSLATARAAFLIAPEGFALAAQSASDNAYMAMQSEVSAERALAQHRGLQKAIREVLPVICFSGDADTPDAVFPNNVFASAPGKLILGHMRHPVRQRESERRDIRDFFVKVLGCQLLDLRAQPGICELTGSLIIDHARGLGFCGLTERCDETGARAMHEAFGLRATLMFDLSASEYHTNVVLSILAGRAAVVAADGFADQSVLSVFEHLYAPHAIFLSPEEKAGFAGNCLALDRDTVWMSEVAATALRPGTRSDLAAAGFAVRAVALDEIEKAGGSLRCCVAEIF